MNFKNRNAELKELIRKSGLRYWQLAEIVGVSDITIGRWLRSKITPEQKARIEKAVEDFKESQEV